MAKTGRFDAFSVDTLFNASDLGTFLALLIAELIELIKVLTP